MNPDTRVRIEPDLYEGLEHLAERAEGIVPVSVESMVNMAVQWFLKGVEE